MFTRSSIYALAAVAALGVTALATSSASARPMGPMGMKVSAHGPMGVSVKPHVQGLVINKPQVQGLVIKQHGPQGVIIKPKPIVGIIINPKPHWPPMVNWCKWHYCGPHWGPVVTGGVGIVGARVVATAPVAPAQSCTCLTKTYLQDGSVQFKDVCTTETAIASPAQLGAQAPGVGPQVQ
jgi:hypothetical protein